MGRKSIKQKAMDLDVFLLGGVLVLVGLGIVIIYSSSSAYAEARNLPSSYYLFHHLKKVVLGFVALVAGLVIHYKYWKIFSRPLMYLCLGLLVLLLAHSGVDEINGAKRWVRIANFGLQPSEPAKIALVIFLAKFLSDKGETIRMFGKGYIAAWVIPLVTFFLILKQPNYSTAGIVMATSGAMIFAAGCRWSHLALSGLAGIPLLAFLMLNSPYRMQRVMAFLKPGENEQSAYQSLQAMISLGNGGIFGTGLGAGTQKLGYLPMPFTDTIFSILGEELGFAGTLICLSVFAFVVWRGLRIAQSTGDKFAGLIAVGFSISLASNVIIHVGVCSGFFPTTGQPLPFVSYGGTALLAALFSMGILLNISANAPPAYQVQQVPNRMKRNRNLSVRGHYSRGKRKMTVPREVTI